MQGKDRYQLHVQPRSRQAWDIRRSRRVVRPPESLPPHRVPAAHRATMPATAPRPKVSRPVDGIVRTRSRPVTAAAQRVVITPLPVTTTVVAPELPRVHHRKRASKRLQLSLRQFSLLASAVVVLGLVSFGGIDTWLSNQRTSGAAVKGASDSHIVPVAPSGDNEGSDETPVPKSAVASYQVAPNMPRYLEISKLGIKARILPMGINTNNSVQAPVNTNDSGWYTESAVPGETGASFIDGHASGATRLGLFGNLFTLAAGDQIKVVMGSGTTYTYAVIKVDIVDLSKVDMSQVLAPYPGVTKGLNLMTCTGVYVPKINNFNKRVIVYTKEIGS